MNIREYMSTHVELCSPTTTLREAARLMKKKDIGALPVGADDRLQGMVTDRDIAIRGLAEGKGPDAQVQEVMSDGIQYCFEDESVEDVSHHMEELRVRRLPVLNREKRLVGIIALADLARIGKADPAIRGISRPSSVENYL